MCVIARQLITARYYVITSFSVTHETEKVASLRNIDFIV